MGKYLKQFETQAAYEAAESGLILPNVSLTVDNDVVHYNQATPSHDFVEIGGIKWATMNIGANSITDYGLYFQWGDSQGYTADQVGSGSGQKYFDTDTWYDYKFTPNGIKLDVAPDYGITKYNTTDGKTVLEASDDAVTAAWGGNWRMPTTAEFQALGSAVTSAWTTDYQGSRVAGLVCTDKNDSNKVLFFPATGYAYNGSVNSVGNSSMCWSSSLNSGNVILAYYMSFSSSRVRWDNSYYRYYGCPLRGVLGENS